VSSRNLRVVSGRSRSGYGWSPPWGLAVAAWAIMAHTGFSSVARLTAAPSTRRGLPLSTTNQASGGSSGRWSGLVISTAARWRPASDGSASITSPPAAPEGQVFSS